MSRPFNTRDAFRPLPADTTHLPTVTRADWDRRSRWWRDETGIPKRCPECRALLANDPPQFERFGRVYCGLGSNCGRVMAWIAGVGW